MASPPSPETRLALARAGAARERVIAALQEHFAHDALDVDELERRVTPAHQSESASEIDALLADLPALETALAPAPKPALVPAADVAPAKTVYGLRSSTERRGAWVVPPRLPAGPVDVDLRAVMSSVDRRLRGEEREGKGAPKARPER